MRKNKLEEENAESAAKAIQIAVLERNTRERERLKENGLNRATKGRVYLLMLGRTDDSEKTAPDKDLPYLKYLEPSAMY